MSQDRDADFEPGGPRWAELREIFERILDAGDPDVVLDSVTDEALRAQSLAMWHSHLKAGSDAFLLEPVSFDVAPVFQQGQTLLDRFEVERLVGKGGMGEVYSAWDRKLAERVALKTIARLLIPSDLIRRRFLAEVQSARRVTHPNVCRIYDLFEDHGRPFFAMEYLDGTPLLECAEKLDRSQKLHLIRQMGDGLAAAHGNGIVHGDFKPGNVIVVNQRPVITDFGLARAIDDASAHDAAHSERGGTGAYMAPELLAGGRPSVQSDIFAFGKVAQEIHPGLGLWSRCTRANPADRPKSVHQILNDLPNPQSRRYFVGAAITAAGTAAGAAALLRRGNENGFVADPQSRFLVNGFRAADLLTNRAGLARSVFLKALSQSPRVQTVSDQELLPSLASLSLPLDGDSLYRVLSLHHADYWIDARLEQIADRFTLHLQLLHGSNAILIWQRVIHSVPSLVQTAELAAAAFRRAAGESEASMLENPAETTSYTSRVPEALEAYYAAMRHVVMGEVAPAIPLLESAIRLDPDFAQALSTLGHCKMQFRHYEEAFHLADKGRRLSTALPEREKSTLEASYYSLEDDPEKMVESARRVVAFFPGEPRYRRNLAQVLCRRGDTADGVDELRKVLALNPNSELMHNEFLVELCEANRYSEALDHYRDAVKAGRSATALAGGVALAHLGLNSPMDALAVLEASPRPSRRMIHSAKIMAGMLDSALAGIRQDVAASERDGNIMETHRAHEFLCGLYYVSDRPVLAASELRAMPPLPFVPTSARSLECAAFWAGRLNVPELLAARSSWAAQLANRWPNRQTKATEEYAAALVDRSRGNLDSAERRLLNALGLAPSFWAYFDIAELFSQIGKPDLEEEYWRKFETRQGYLLKLWFPGLLLDAWLRRAKNAASRGDRANTREYSGRILKHWAGLKPEPALVRAARQLNATTI